MKRVAIVVPLLLAWSGVARADDSDALYACHPVAAGTRMHVSFKPDTTIFDLSVWVSGFTCKNVVFGEGVARHATRVTVISPTDVTPKQAVALFVDALDAAGLKVVAKADTFIIKPGPGMPASCPDVTASAPPPPTASDDLEPAVEAALDAGIRRIDDTHYEITRGLANQLVSDPSVVLRGARVVPSYADGKPNGLKLYAIRPRSFFARVGLANGDTIRTVNALPVTTPDEALAAYDKVKSASAFVLEGIRRGQPLTLVIKVVTR
jgi:hypothetical protein